MTPLNSHFAVWLALHGLPEIPPDIYNIVDSGDGYHVRKNVISSLKNLTDKWAVKALKEKLDIYDI